MKNINTNTNTAAAALNLKVNHQTRSSSNQRPKHAMYFKPDDRHYAVRANIQISDQFFGWLLGLGKRMRIIDPPEVVEQFKEYLDKVRGMYEHQS